MSFYDEYEIEEYEKITEQIANTISGKKLTRIEVADIQKSDTIYISFFPCSQKYIYSLPPKLGQVIKIEPTEYINYNNEVESKLVIKIINNQNVEEDLFHPGVSYMGHSLGYDFTIYLVE